MDVAPDYPTPPSAIKAELRGEAVTRRLPRVAAPVASRGRYRPLPWLLSSCQPMSSISGLVRSRLSVRSGLIAGSMMRFGEAIGSQCEMEEPGTTGLGALICANPSADAPARLVRSSPRVAVTPLASCALIASPVARVIRPEGMVIVGSTPPRPPAGESGPF